MPTIEEFEIVYARLTYSPSPIPHGLSYEHLLTACEAAGRPADIVNFLIHGKAENPADGGELPEAAAGS